jgi:dihydrofolate synthase/folylpolyglutamate synthase
VTFDESLEWLGGTQFFGIKLGLENTRSLLDHLGNPERSLCIIHVAGTNGKGSVCAMLDAIFREAGIRCGLYTSPHLCDFRERVRVDGENISPEAAARWLTRLRELCSGWPHSPTYFELATVLALAHFAQEGCGVVVLETGMGGRLDATNAVTPVVSVITPIARDHAEWLGDSMAKIAGEKAGIIKPGISVVSAPQSSEAEAVLQAVADANGSPLRFVEVPWGGDVGLRGAHQKWNAALAVAAMEAAGMIPRDGNEGVVEGAGIMRRGHPRPVPLKAVVSGLQKVVWPARFQRMGRIVLDGAHNPHAAETLVATWRECFGAQKPVIVFGAMKDKDSREMLAILSGIAASFCFVPIASPRSAEPESFRAMVDCPTASFPSVEAGLRAAMQGGAPVLVTGSLFLAGEALPLAAILS